jgi:hypothetical protein
MTLDPSSARFAPAAAVLTAVALQVAAVFWQGNAYGAEATAGNLQKYVKR